MEKNNKLYKNQGIHVISTIFTVDKGETKVLLIKRKNEPYKDKWALVGGALYNNEDLIDGLNREIKEKTGIENINLYLSNTFGKVDRSPVMRMVAISYIGIVDFAKIEYLKETLKTSDAKLFKLNEIPELAYDHNEILEKAKQTLEEKVLYTDILKGFFPNGFTIPEIQNVYETILNVKVDRRNFRKKLLNLEFIEETDDKININGKKPANIYKFKEKDGKIF